MRKIEIGLCDLDEFSLGLFSGYGEDEYSYFKVFNIGFLIFEITIFTYIDEE